MSKNPLDMDVESLEPIPESNYRLQISNVRAA